MASEITIDLTKPLTTTGGAIVKQITLRAPTLRDIDELGTMIVVTSYDNEFVIPKIQYPVLGAYIRRCIVAPPGAEEWLDNVRLADALQLRDAMVRLARAVDTAARAMQGLPYGKSKRRENDV